MESSTLLYCDHCFMTSGIKVPLKLTIIETSTWEADFTRNSLDQIDDLTHEPIPTFAVETGDGVVEWDPCFICPVCDTPAWLLNRQIVYDEENDLLLIPDLDETSIIGYHKAPPRDQELPKIQKVSKILCPSN